MCVVRASSKEFLNAANHPWYRVRAAINTETLQRCTPTLFKSCAEELRLGGGWWKVEDEGSLHFNVTASSVVGKLSFTCYMGNELHILLME